jgi:hypothetical protein
MSSLSWFSQCCLGSASTEGLRVRCRSSVKLAALTVLLSACTAQVDSEGPDTDSAEQALSAVSATFATEISGQFLCAEQGGGGVVNANRPAAKAWETFKLLDRNDGALESGDVVYIQAANGSYLQAESGGGRALNAASKNQLDWEAFRVVKRQGSGKIQSGDIVGLQTLSGFWVSALNGGGGAVDVHARALSGWEAFRIGLGSQNDNGNDGRKLVWSDEFDGPGIDENKWNWEVQRPGWVNHELQNYTNKRWENARVEDGHLVIEGRRDWFGGYEYSSARLKTQGKASWRYGRVEARIQVPGGRGTWPAFWMMPDDFSRGWPACGEMDILEHVGYDLNVVHATLHAQAYNWQRSEQRTASTVVSGATTGYHVYVLDWRPDRIEMSVDGRVYFSMQNPNRGNDWWPFDKNFYVIFNLAIGGDWGGAQGVDPNVWPQRMLVDYVRVYQ